jgi:hypothetical protein
MISGLAGIGLAVGTRIITGPSQWGRVVWFRIPAFLIRLALDAVLVGG